MYQVQHLIQVKSKLSKSTCNFVWTGLQLLLSMHNFVTSYRIFSGEMESFFSQSLKGWNLND